MSKYKSEFLNIMNERGFIHQISNEEALDELFTKETVSAYIGFDPTAKSLHVGSLLQIMMLYWLQQSGHNPIVVMGGSTAMIGDPSFKDEARQLLSQETVNENIQSIKNVFSNYLDFNGSARLVNNADWLKDIIYLDFLRDVGRYFSINRMLSFDSVKLRLDREQSLSFLEFNYMILQAYDFVHLHKEYGIRLQLGGSDQWGNIVNGIDLAHKMRLPQLYALTSPLLTTSSGVKMGKTANGAVWLNRDMLDSFSFWQYWRNCEDADVIRFFKLYTNISMDEINRYAKLQGKEINEAKKILATQITALLHGKKAAKEAELAAENLFEKNLMEGAIPNVTISLEKEYIGLLTLLVKVGFASSNSEARRAIKSGAIRINDTVINDEALNLSKQNLNCDGFFKLSFGKKKHVLVNFVDTAS